jgi:hypothetical protein
MSSDYKDKLTYTVKPTLVTISIKFDCNLIKVVNKVGLTVT